MPHPNTDLTLAMKLCGLGVAAVGGDVPDFSEARAGVGGSARANWSSPILKETAPQTCMQHRKAPCVH